MRILLLLFGFLVMGVIHASGSYDPTPPIVNNYETNNYYSETFNVLDDDALSDVLAASMAADAISFGTNTRKWQLGLGAGYHEGAEAWAVGMGKMVETEKMEFLFSLKGAHSNSDWGVGIGATIQLD